MDNDEKLELAYEKAIDAMGELFGQHAGAIASDFNLDYETAAKTLSFAVIRRFDNTRAGSVDSRMALWRCRFRIYDSQHMDDPIADSDDEMPPDQPGSMVIAGLPNVAGEVTALATTFHKSGQMVGLDTSSLDRGLRGLRPTLSRNKGKATWRVWYDTLETFNERSQKRGWLMRVDIIREEAKQ